MKRRTGGDDTRTFESAMRGVERVGEPRRRSPVRTRRRSSLPVTGPRFDYFEEASRCYGRRVDVASERLDELRAGKIAAANRLDLHGMSEEAARDGVFRFVRQASQSGLRCVAIVHGRGLRSPDGPVLKRALPRWLMQLPLSHWVAAFGSAPRDAGGDGVTLVLLESR